MAAIVLDGATLTADADAVEAARRAVATVLARGESLCALSDDMHDRPLAPDIELARASI
jgi:hypothetical protein